MKSSTDRASAYGNGGSLPSGWHIRQLGAVASEVVSRNAELKMGREHVLSVDNEKGLVPSTRKLGDDFSRYKLITSGQFAYNPMRLNVGSIALKRNGTPALVSPDYVVFRCCDDDLDPSFLDFYRRTQAWKASIAMSGQGSVRVRYYFHHIAAFPMALPPLREQQAIAGVLRTVQAAREACERVIAATRQLKHSLLAHLFTYGPVPLDHADRVVLGETQIGRTPADWQIVRLADVAELRSGGTPSKTKPGFWAGIIPWASPKDMKLPRLYDTKDHISEEGLADGSRLMPARSLFIVIRGMILTRDIPVAMAMVPMAMNQDMKAIIPHDRINSDYLLYAIASFKHRLAPEVGTSAHGTRRISTAAVENLLLPLPPIEEQREIASQLSAVDAKLTAEEARRDALAALFASLLENLMTGRVRLPEFAG